MKKLKTKKLVNKKLYKKPVDSYVMGEKVNEIIDVLFQAGIILKQGDGYVINSLHDHRGANVDMGEHYIYPGKQPTKGD